MKKAHVFNALAVLLLFCTVFSCQRENVYAPSDTVSENQQAFDRGPCDMLNVSNGAGLEICGLLAGSKCDLCGTSDRGEVINGIFAQYNLNGSGTFVLTNNSSVNQTVALTFNCAVNAINIVIPAGTSILFTVQIDSHGCCIPVSQGPC